MIEKPMTKTRFNTLPMACERGATRSNVFVATWMSRSFLVSIGYMNERMTNYRHKYAQSASMKS